MTLTPVITDIGLQKAIAAENDGVNLHIARVGFGSLGYEPSADREFLAGERFRPKISGAERINETQVHITAVENSQQEYFVREIGFYLDDDTLFAVWSDPDNAIAYKAAGVDLVVSLDLSLSALPGENIIFDDSGGLSLAPATINSFGSVRLATEPEAISGFGQSVMTAEQVRRISDARYKKLSDTSANQPLLVTEGRMATTNRFSQANWDGAENDINHNYVDVLPPAGFNRNQLVGFIASMGNIYFDGNVDASDTLFLKWHYIKDAPGVRVVCNNTKNRKPSVINYLAIWRTN